VLGGAGLSAPWKARDVREDRARNSSVVLTVALQGPPLSIDVSVEIAEGKFREDNPAVPYAGSAWDRGAQRRDTRRALVTGSQKPRMSTSHGLRKVPAGS
jgi:hypothetical protein